jgi:hypothetical protein
MPITLAALLFLPAFVAAGPVHDKASCPMAAPDARRDQVDHRHDEATGVAHEGSVHHFLLAKDGGSIRLEVTDATQVEARDRIREHLQIVARSFAAGDFSLPMLIHDQVPPGVDLMKELEDAIHYSYAPTDGGGVVRISTQDPRALEAVHQFLRFQIQDHGTHDPLD